MLGHRCGTTCRHGGIVSLCESRGNAKHVLRASFRGSWLGEITIYDLRRRYEMHLGIGCVTTPAACARIHRNPMVLTSSPAQKQKISERRNGSICSVCHKRYGYCRINAYGRSTFEQARYTRCASDMNGNGEFVLHDDSGNNGGRGGWGDEDNDDHDGIPSMTSVAAVGHTGAAGPLEDVVILDVNGMRCAGCVSRVKEILEAETVVTAASVNLATETAVVKIIIPDSNPVDFVQSHQSSVSTLEHQKSDVPGVPSADTIDVEIGNSKIDTYNKRVESIALDLARILSEMGYETRVRPRDGSSGAALKVVQAKRALRLEKIREASKRLVVAWFLASGCLIHHLVHWLGPASTPIWLRFLSSTPVTASLSALALLGPGRSIVSEGFSALFKGAPDMNSLVGIGAVAAFGISSVAALMPKLGWQTFFEEPAMLLGVVLIGRTLEERAKLRASADMAALSGLLPPKARLLLSNGRSWRDVPSETIISGDLVAVLPGDRIPVDGVVVNGRSTVNESALTGEPLPVTKTLGNKVTAGTVNCDGHLIVEAKASGGDTAVADIIKLVESAQARAAPIQRLADSVAGRFTYGVMGAAALTFGFWATVGTRMFPHVVSPYLSTAAVSKGAASLLLSLQLACNVLVVACPCALGLAAPTAVLVGTGAGARRGLLIRGGDVLEAASHIDTVVFDKTGTLTAGEPVVVEAHVIETASKHKGSCFSQAEMLSLAAAVEASSTHPIGKAITRFVKENIPNSHHTDKETNSRGHKSSKKLTLNAVEDGSFVQKPGSGVTGIVDGHRVSVGNFEWVSEQIISYQSENIGTSSSPNLKGCESNEKPEIVRNNQDASLSVLSPSLEYAASKPGNIIVHIGIDDVIAGAIEISDKLRPDAKEAVHNLQKMGIKTLMLSGDQVATANAVAKELGIPENSVYAGVKPAGKSEVVEQLKRQGSKIAMVGDGVNDAAALVAADVGIAMGGGVDAASEVADVVLLGDRVPQVLDVLDLSRATISTIKQNMFWAFGYNLICIPLAAGALLPSLGIGLTPSVSGGLMGLSSLAVMANSLLLQNRGGRGSGRASTSLTGKVLSLEESNQGKSLKNASVNERPKTSNKSHQQDGGMAAA